VPREDRGSRGGGAAGAAADASIVHDAQAPELPAWEEPAPNDPRGMAVVAAVRRARPRLSLGGRDVLEVWLLRHVGEGRYDARLARHLDEESERLAADPYLGVLADADAARPEVPEYPLTGLLRATGLLVVAVGEPEEAAVRVLRQAVKEPATPFDLIHRFFALFLFEAFGRELPTDLAEARAAVRAEIEEQHAADGRTKDPYLFAARAMALAVLEGACPAQLDGWAQQLVEMQGDDGLWGDASEVQITTISVAVLRTYIKCHHGEGTERR
jgi:hypothetical protein